MADRVSRRGKKEKPRNFEAYCVGRSLYSIYNIFLTHAFYNKRLQNAFIQEDQLDRSKATKVPLSLA